MKSPEPSDHFTGDWDAITVIVAIASALSLYNALELILLILTTFRKYKGLYFWSLVVAGVGVIAYTLGYIIEYFRVVFLAIGIAIDTTGWSMMVTGQSVVLYSRLGIVLGQGHRQLLRMVKWMIIIDAVVFHVTTTTLVFGAHYAHGTNHSNFSSGYYYMEKVQMTGFTIQEFILSGLYVWKTLDILKAGDKKKSHRVMWQLFTINVIIIILDIGLLTIEFMNFHVLEQTIKGATYSIKLKLEFAILSKLVELTRPGGGIDFVTSAIGDTRDFVDPARATSFVAVTKAPSARSRRSNYDPHWMDEVEKSNIQYVERVETRSNQPTPDASEDTIFVARGRSGSDAMYADVCRSIA